MFLYLQSDSFQQDIYPQVPGDTSALTSEDWFSGKNADPILISLQDGFVATKKEFITTTQNAQEENIFAVGMKTAPQREEDVSENSFISLTFSALSFSWCSHSIQLLYFLLRTS